MFQSWRVTGWPSPLRNVCLALPLLWKCGEACGLLVVDTKWGLWLDSRSRTCWKPVVKGGSVAIYEIWKAKPKLYFPTNGKFAHATCFRWLSLRKSEVPYNTVNINPSNPELNPICYLLALLGAHHFLQVSRIRVKLLTFRLLMSYIWSTHSWCF